MGMDYTAKLFTSRSDGQKRRGEGEEEKEGKKGGLVGGGKKGGGRWKEGRRKKKTKEKTGSLTAPQGHALNSLKPPTIPHLFKFLPPLFSAKVEPSLQHLDL